MQVVYGRQTTGKSSLLGALCGIQLPTGDNQVTPASLALSSSAYCFRSCCLKPMSLLGLEDGFASHPS